MLYFFTIAVILIAENALRRKEHIYYLFATAFVIAIIELSYKEYTVKKHLSPLCVRGLSVILGLKGRKLV